MRNRTLFVDKNKKVNFQKSKLPQILTPSMSSMSKPAMSQSQFNYQYSQFTLDLPIYKQVKQNLKYFYQLYSNMCQYGGLVTTLANNKLRDVINDMSIKFPQLANMTFENVLEHYLKFNLFSFQIVLNTGKRIENQKLMCFGICKFVEGQQLKQVFNNKQAGIKLYDSDLIVLNSLCSHLELSQQIFNAKKLIQKQGQETIKVIIQQISYSNNTQQNSNIKNKKYSQKLNKNNALTNNPQIGFQKYKNYLNMEVITQQLNKAKVQSIETTLKEYVSYYNLASSQNQKDRNNYLNNKLYVHYVNNNGFSHRQNQRVLYGQFDPKDQFFIQEISNKIDGTFLGYKQKFDLLSYADQDVSGVTLPIFSFQLHGSWCGGVQQPFGLSKVDINFGPDETQWFCISSDHVNKFFIAFKSQMSFGAQKIEGQWFQQVDWFIQRKIPIKKVIQKKGDGILIGSGSLSWFRSIGKSLHASWNVMVKSQKQIVATTNRCNRIRQMNNVGKIPKTESICQIIRIKQKQTKIPLKAILLRVINHQQYSITKKKEDFRLMSLSLSSIIIIRQYLKKFYTQQEKCLNTMTIREDLIDIKYKLYHLFDAQSYCSHCQLEILNYFVNFNGLCCLECISRYFLNKKIVQLKDKTVYHKYDPFWLYQLIYYGNARSIDQKNLYFLQFEQLCCGQFILNNQICTKKKKIDKDCQLQKIEWDSILNQYEQQRLDRGQNAHISKFINIFNKKLQNKSIGQNQLNDQLIKNCSIQTNLSLSTRITDEQINQYSQSLQSKKGHNSDNIKTKHETQFDEFNAQSMKRNQRKRLNRDYKQQKSFGSGSDQQLDSQRTKYRGGYRVHYDREQYNKNYNYYKREIYESNRSYWKNNVQSPEQGLQYNKYPKKTQRSQHRSKRHIQNEQ